jgi:hypothetical protein
MQFFIVNVYYGCKFCPSLLQTAGIHISTQNIGCFPLFAVSSSCKAYSFVRCTSTENFVCKDINILYLVNIWLHLIVF